MRRTGLRARGRVAGATCAVLLALTGAAASGAPRATAARGYDPSDPGTWTSTQLAAQMVFGCVDWRSWPTARTYAARGIGGLTVLGTPDESLAAFTAQWRSVRLAAPGGVAPMVASDEEGGLVQRLRLMLYPLPSAKTMGAWTTTGITTAARSYGQRMRAAEVRMDLAPVADLAIPGYFIDEQRRGFSADPGVAGRAASAWALGMRQAGVVPVVKHWPGHGQAADSHTGPAVAPPLTTLQRRDMLPFRAAIGSGVRVVMVGHLASSGLTEPGRPASESPSALRYLRAQAGAGAVILTDSLSMAAASSALGISPYTAALRAVQAGADWVMACGVSPLAVAGVLQRALVQRLVPWGSAVASVRRILAVKQGVGLAPS